MCCRYLAQQQERCMPAELQSLEWQPLSQHAAHVAPVSVAEMEPCVIGVCEYTLMTPEMVSDCNAQTALDVCQQPNEYSVHSC